MTATRMRRHQHFQQERMALAETPEARLAAACDWLRSSARKLGNRRDGSAGARDRALTEAANMLARIADAIDRGDWQ